jgi:hypothetical protein
VAVFYSKFVMVLVMVLVFWSSAIGFGVSCSNSADRQARDIDTSWVTRLGFMPVSYLLYTDKKKHLSQFAELEPELYSKLLIIFC